MLSQKPARVFVKVARATLSMASVRYRALLPAIVLEHRRIASLVITDDIKRFNPKRFDIVVIVKSFSAKDQALAAHARAEKLAVIFDLCDNIYVDGYKSKSVLPTPLAFYQIASLCDLIVCSTTPLKERVERQIRNVTPVSVTPDGMETEELRSQQAVLLKREQSKWRRLRSWLRPFVMAIRHGKPVGLANATLSPERIPAPTSQRKKIVWFGNHGAPYGQFGMLDILRFRDALERIAQQFDIELVVISNNRSTFEELMRSLTLPARYAEWTSEIVPHELRDASAVIVPNSTDEFAICKSANRTVLALMHGAPVIAECTPALEPLREVVWQDNPYDGLYEAIDNPAQAKARARRGLERCQALFGDDVVAEHWQRNFANALESSRARAQRPKIGIVLDLAQDWDVAVCVIDRLNEIGMDAYALVSTTLAVGSDARTVPSLLARAVPFAVMADKFSHADAIATLKPLSALISFAESSLRPHRFANRLAKFAKGMNIVTATVQHGYENVGLTYSDSVHPIADVQILSDVIFTWGPLTSLHPEVDDETRGRCVPAGCPKPAQVPAIGLSALEAEKRPIIGVLENLHWHRYSDTYREAFIESLTLACKALPDVVFLLKPHHAGRWLTERYRGPDIKLPNLLIADPLVEPWSHYTAPQLFSFLCGVVTTPSTVALDAARYGLPVAVTRFDLELPQYEPLPQITAAKDLIDFAKYVSSNGAGRESMLAKIQDFTRRAIVPGDGAKVIAETIARHIGIKLPESVR